MDNEHLYLFYVIFHNLYDTSIFYSKNTKTLEINFLKKDSKIIKKINFLKIIKS